MNYRTILFILLFVFTFQSSQGVESTCGLNTTNATTYYCFNANSTANCNCNTNVTAITYSVKCQDHPTTAATTNASTLEPTILPETTTTTTTTRPKPSCEIHALLNPQTYKCECIPGFKGTHGVACKEYCAAKILRNSFYNEAWVGAISYSNITCKDGRRVGYASCKPGGTFDTPTTVACSETLEKFFSQSNSIIKPPVATGSIPQQPSSEQIQTVTSTLQLLTTGVMSPNETKLAVEVVQNMSSFNVNVKSFQNIVQTANNVLEQTETVVKDTFTGNTTKSNLVVTLNKFAVNVEFSTNGTDDAIDIFTPTIEMKLKAVRKEVPTAVVFRYVTEVAQEGNSTTAMTQETSKITISSKFVEEAQNIKWCSAGQLRFYTFQYKTRHLFNTSVNTSHTTTVGMSCNGTEIRTNFTNPIKIEFAQVKNRTGKVTMRKNKYLTKETKLFCQRWNAFLNRYIRIEPTTEVNGTPSCNFHSSGSFSILITSQIVTSMVALEKASEVGCSISIVGLLLTMLIYLTSKPLRQRKPTPIMMNVCFCLAVSYFIFLFGIDKAATNDPMCTVATLALHYFLLCAWAWMFANSVFMYYSLVKVLSSRSNRKLYLVYITAYVLPLIIVVVTSCTAYLHVDKNFDFENNYFFESAYRYNNMCWIRNLSLYFSFLMPVGFMLTGNLVFFAAILSSILNKDEIRSTAKEIGTFDQMMIAVCMIAMMGLTWIFAFMILVSTSPIYVNVMSWVFVILNTTQGILIFFMMCLRQQNVREVWFHPLMRCISCGSCYKKKPPNDISLIPDGGTGTHQRTNRNSST